jgi:hypothetical protein
MPIRSGPASRLYEELSAYPRGIAAIGAFIHMPTNLSQEFVIGH